MQYEGSKESVCVATLSFTGKSTMVKNDGFKESIALTSVIRKGYVFAFLVFVKRAGLYFLQQRVGAAATVVFRVGLLQKSLELSIIRPRKNVIKQILCYFVPKIILIGKVV